MSEPRSKILIVDDDEDMRKLLAIRVNSRGFDVETASDGASALKLLATARPDVVVTDLRMPGMDGMTLLEAIQREAPTVPVIMITAHGTIPDAVRATQVGAYGFITKPIDKDELFAQLDKATAPRNGSGTTLRGGDIVTRNRAMKDLLEKARRAAGAGISALLSGESGTGKELLARYIHEASGRTGEFVAVNCGALPETLLESELFGHVKGAFTDARESRSGLMKEAEGGTLLLDEIGDMPPAVQAKLLRALQERKVRPLGASAEVDIDVLVVSATHRDLSAMVEGGTFREDLYYRVNVVELNVPPLRGRPEDIPLLVSTFVESESHSKDERKVFAPEAMELMSTQAWPGNVRQLRNVVQQALAMSPSPVISAAQVRDAIGDRQRHLPSFDEARDEFTRNYLMQILTLAEGNVSRAARLADRNRSDFHKLLKKHGIDSSQFKS
ncbi:MAG: sigma 54-interacting transcriptional regulator [Pseudomonadales bacterium]|nr:sigma 54-interacting transcriptional regulator [Pseudomonadales bacterium]